MLNIEIEVSFYVKEPWIQVTRDTIITDNEIRTAAECLLSKLLLLSGFRAEYKGHADWFLTGETKEDAMNKKIISGSHFTDNAVDLLFRDLEDGFPLIVNQIWNESESEDENGDVISYMNFVQSSYSFFHYELSFKFDNAESVTDFAFKIIDKIVASISPKIIQVETNDYTLKEKMVFPDRSPVGWMFYTDKLYEPGTIVPAEHMRQINKDGIPAGTLFITKHDFFDGANKQDIQMSNDMEIILASYEILPKHRDNL